MNKILLVEDDVMISQIYRRKLEKAGFEVDIAESGELVMDKVHDTKYDLVLLDLVLPGISGMDVLEKLHREGLSGEILRIIISSNLNDIENQEKAMQLGASGFISKSQYNPSEFAKEVQRLLKQFHEQDGNAQRLSDANNETNVEIPVATAPEAESKRIVFIEDEDLFIDLFVEKLQHEGYTVDIARTGLQGLEKIYEGQTDLVITDIMMPKMKGDEVVKRLKSNPDTNQIPIIALSASVSDEEIKQIQQYGVTNFFVKTEITPSDLVRRVRELL